MVGLGHENYLVILGTKTKQHGMVWFGLIWFGIGNKTTWLCIGTKTKWSQIGKVWELTLYCCQLVRFRHKK